MSVYWSHLIHQSEALSFCFLELSCWSQSALTSGASWSEALCSCCMQQSLDALRWNREHIQQQQRHVFIDVYKIMRNWSSLNYSNVVAFTELNNALQKLKLSKWLECGGIYIWNDVRYIHVYRLLGLLFDKYGAHSGLPQLCITIV